MKRLQTGRHWPAVFLYLAVASAVCVGLIALRWWKADDPGLTFLVWNLVLAWVPFVLAIAVYGGYRHNAPAPVLLLLGGLWLLFLPNAPYLVTDFIHVGAVPGVPAWYDAVVVTVFAVTGLLLGFASIYLVQAVTAHRLGERFVWTLVLGVIALTAVGIYIGRVHRLNSWDAFRSPGDLVGMVQRRLGDPLSNPELLVMMAVSTVALMVTYVVLCAAVLPRVPLLRRRRRGGATRVKLT
jgi:uncharacterized membrane protein